MARGSLPALLLCALLVCPAVGWAGSILDGLSVSIEQVGVGTMPLDPLTDLNCSEDLEAGTAVCMGIGMTLTPANPDFTWELSNWQFLLVGDPSVNQNFAIRNTSSTPVSLIVSTSIAAGPLAGPTLMGGSSGGSVTDSNADGVGGLATSTPNPFYVGLIDGLPVAGTALHADPYYAPGPGFPGTFAAAGDTVNITATSFGLPGPSTPGPAVTSSIGIQNAFQLGGMDSVASTNFFEVVPEPGTASLLGLALAGLALLRRASA